MKLLGVELFAEKWDHTAHVLDTKAWLCGYERTRMGDHKVWIGPFFLSWCRTKRTTKRDRKGPDIRKQLDGEFGGGVVPPSETT